MKHVSKAAGVTLATTFLSAAALHGQQPVASFHYDERGAVIRQDQDSNGDGKMDRSIYYDSDARTERVERDVNFDGKPDIVVFYESGKPARQEIASKNDGRIDTWLYLDDKGEILRKGQDTDRSGKPTLWTYYENGRPVRSEETSNSTGNPTRQVHYQEGKINRVEEDTNGDGKFDSFSYFEQGQLVKKDLDRKHMGKVDLWGYYQDGRLVKQEEDLHGDGKIGRIIFFRGDEIVRREEDTARRGRMDLIELFSQGRLTRRLRDSKGAGEWDLLYYYQDNLLTREERDTNGDGVFDLRVLYEKDQIIAQEGDTNGDRRVDVARAPPDVLDEDPDSWRHLRRVAFVLDGEAPERVVGEQVLGHLLLVLPPLLAADQGVLELREPVREALDRPGLRVARGRRRRGAPEVREPRLARGAVRILFRVPELGRLSRDPQRTHRRVGELGAALLHLPRLALVLALDREHLGNRGVPRVALELGHRCVLRRDPALGCDLRPATAPDRPAPRAVAQRPHLGDRRKHAAPRGSEGMHLGAYPDA